MKPDKCFQCMHQTCGHCSKHKTTIYQVKDCEAFASNVSKYSCKSKETIQKTLNISQY